MQEAAQKVPGTVWIDAPCPAEIHPDIAVVLGKRHQFVVIRIGDMHQDKPGVRIASEKVAHISGGNSAHRHPVVARVISRVDFERQIVRDREFHAARPAPVPQAQARLHRDVLIRPRQYFLQCGGRLRVVPFLPVQSATVGMLCLHRDGASGIFREEPFHRLPEGIETGHLYVRLGVYLPRIDLAVAESRPGEIVEEKIESRFIRQACPLEIVRLNVIQSGRVAQQP